VAPVTTIDRRVMFGKVVKPKSRLREYRAHFDVPTTRSKKRGGIQHFIRPFTSNLLPSSSAVTSVAPGPYPEDEPFWAISSQKKLCTILPDSDMIEHRPISSR
jgi:hypothetical protein